MATASYQIEGAVAEDGRTPSIWDTFSRIPGAVLNGDTGEVACDHYHRMPADVDLLADLGATSYRFSVAWPRVRPDAGPVNAAGLAFYDRLVDELLAHGIAPWLTLYHWDLPQVLEDAGGWTNRDTAHRFVEYAASVHDALGDRVPTWTTLNEPWCSAFLGYSAGHHAPGRQEGAAGLVAAHHLLLGARHGDAGAAQPRRRPARAQPQPHRARPERPARPGRRRRRPAHRRAAQPVLPRPDLPRRLPRRRARGHRRPALAGPAWYDVVRDGDLAVDLRADRRAGRELLPRQRGLGSPAHRRRRHRRRPPRPGGAVAVRRLRARHLPEPRAAASPTWAGRSSPTGLHRLLRRLHDDYPHLPIYLTETGAAFADRPDERRRGARPRPHRVPRLLPARGAPRDRGGRRRPRLLPVVVLRQLRVGLRLRQALRPGPRRLRDAAAYAQVERPLVRRARPHRASCRRPTPRTH